MRHNLKALNHDLRVRDNEVIQYIHDAFEHLATRFPHDFRAHYSWALLSGRSVIKGHVDSKVLDVERKQTPPATDSLESQDPWELLRSLRQYRKYTTQYFQNLEMNFLHVLSVHFVFAQDACKRAAQWYRENHKENRQKRVDSVANLRNAVGTDPYWAIGYSEKLQVAQLYCYEHSMEHFHELLTGWRWYTLDKKMVEEVWWLLMLRGVSWDMSVRIENDEPTVHASIYENQTPVWIN